MGSQLWESSGRLVVPAVLIIGAYLLGSVPAAHLAARWLRHTDLRDYGGGTVSGSMVWEHVARWAIVPVGLFDVAKAALPAWLALTLGLGEPVAAVAGLAATVGHCWPVFLHFTGGRGLSGFVGAWLILYPWGSLWILVLLAIGWRLGDSAPWALASLATLPLLAALTGGPALVLPLSAAMLLLTLAKRLEANRRPLPSPGPARRRVIAYRLIFDRDIPSHSEWIGRRPDEARGREAET
jgi:glycerol-3-phosphate acyltransferase PlsY